jgi:hypothetical protein
MELLKFNRLKVLIDGTDYTNHVPFPFKWSALLDEQLDEATLELVRVPIDNFEQLLDVVVKVWNDSDETRVITHNMLVANDDAHEIPVGSGKYNHTLYLIEETKYLEGFYVRSHGYVKSLKKKYDLTVVGDILKSVESPIKSVSTPTISVPKTSNDTYLPSLSHVCKIEEYVDKIYTYTSKFLSGEIQILQNGITVSTNNNTTQLPTIPIYVPTGTFEAIYKVNFDVQGVLNVGGNTETVHWYPSVTIKYELTCLPQDVYSVISWTARSVIERALILAEPLREGNCPRFWLNPTQAAEFEKIAVPEFQFTQSNLREILQGIGQYIHGEPRLKGHEIYYDMYGSSEQTEPYSVYAAKEVSRTLDRYTTNIDSSVGNLVNSLGYAKGVFVEPFAGAALSMRCETMYARVTEDNMIFPTKFGINSVEKFEYYDDTNNKFWDITPCVVESADYNQMSSFGGVYPLTKGFALYYTQGEKGIAGFNFKTEGWLLPAYSSYAIINILSVIMGSNPGVSDYAKMQFRITYQAFMPARVQQNKSLIVAKKHFTTAYNQGQNVVESSYYGENIKGVVARLGNVDKVVTVVKQGLPIIPKVGTLYDDDYYISTVAVEAQPQTTKITLALSQDFNRYSAYVSLDRQKRQYEISEKAAYESMLSYRDYAIIGDNATTYGDAITKINKVVEFIQYPQDTNKPVTLLKAKGVDVDGNNLQEVALPCQPAAMGNSIVFISGYKDNYSAGESATYQENGTVSGYFQQGVPYSDGFGNIEKLHLEYYTGGKAIGEDNEFNLASTLPAANYLLPDDSPLITTGDNPLWVKKGSTEILGINYQIDFVSNRRSIIIGSGFAKYCSLVNGYDDSEISLVLLKNRLNKFERTVKFTEADKRTFPKFTILDEPRASFNAYTLTQADGNIKAWAVVKGDELLFGENKAYAVGDNIFANLYITMAHDYLPPAYTDKLDGGITLYPNDTSADNPVKKVGDEYVVDWQTTYDNAYWVNIRGVNKPNDTATVPNGLKPYQDANGIWHIVGKLYTDDNVVLKITAFKWR